MKRKAIKDSIRKETKKIKELPNEFVNEMACYCIQEELHMKTIYQLCKVKHMDQMLDTMYDNIVEEYNLHVPTLERLRDSIIKENTQNKLEKLKLRLPRL
jgi:hypothetical protein